jgi:hypothetical protein
MYNLATFGFSDMMDCRSKIRAMIDADPATIGEGAEQVVQFFRREFVDDAGEPVFPLARLFKTHPFNAMEEDLKEFARRIEPGSDDIPGLRCLVLLATDGDKPEWRSRRSSKGHQAIPLTSESAVAKAPMIAQLVEQFGIPVATVIRPDPALLLDLGEKAYNVFYVPTAPGSPYIVAQEEFVVPFGIRSVIGFGGMLATGDLFALILFSRVEITPAVADVFKVIGLNLKLAMMRIARKPMFAQNGMIAG